MFVAQQEQASFGSILRGFRDDSNKRMKCRDYGLKTFYDPANAVADIVFVHGITGHFERTWTAGEAGARPWPERLLPAKIPNARVLSFGYDAAVAGWRSNISGNWIGDHAKNLLASLAQVRKSIDTHRPIIFVCHSLGGIVCKDALCFAKTSPEKHIQQLLNCIMGIVFLGTPHSGTGLAKVAGRLARFMRSPITRTNLRILEVLRRDSEVLSRIQDQFHSLIRCRNNEQLPSILITCFYEEVPLSGIGEIVPKHSAILPGYTAVGIHCDHRDIARFATEKEPGFISICAELQRWIKGADIEIPSGIAEAREGAALNIGNRGIKGLSGKKQDGIVIYGSLMESNVVNGDMTIYGGITFH